MARQLSICFVRCYTTSLRACSWTAGSVAFSAKARKQWRMLPRTYGKSCHDNAGQSQTWAYKGAMPAKASMQLMPHFQQQLYSSDSLKSDQCGKLAPAHVPRQLQASQSSMP